MCFNDGNVCPPATNIDIVMAALGGSNRVDVARVGAKERQVYLCASFRGRRLPWAIKGLRVQLVSDK